LLVSADNHASSQWVIQPLDNARVCSPTGAKSVSVATATVQSAPVITSKSTVNPICSVENWAMIGP
ncbi:MAG: hypothetical protein MUQ43_12480, partial [Reinekea forsetii]|nr:hypothetical protein [Reinekea forsetii]